jgi:Cu(I)-responsive transcriptional regulator
MGMSERGETAFIGRVARETGLTIYAIRFYEAERVLPKAPRTESGYRVYTEEDVKDLKFIKRAQELGFSLKEIRELLLLRRERTKACSHVRDLLQEKLEDVKEKLRELEKLRSELQVALRSCNRDLRRSQSGEKASCPVLEELGRTEESLRNKD